MYDETPSLDTVYGTIFVFRVSRIRRSVRTEVQCGLIVMFNTPIVYRFFKIDWLKFCSVLTSELELLI